MTGTVLESNRYEAVLFDLDGTLVDTAPDMVAILQALQQSHGIVPIQYEVGRSHVSNGALGLIRAGFPAAGDDLVADLHADYLQRYAAKVCEHSRVFDGLDDLLVRLDAIRLPWGVVTNKPSAFTLPLLTALALTQRAACIVSGDTLSKRKPDPAPLLHACQMADIDPQHTIYVGDAARDIVAGTAAGMATIAAGYGYITSDDDARSWNATAVAANTAELLRLVMDAARAAA